MNKHHDDRVNNDCDPLGELVERALRQAKSARPALFVPRPVIPESAPRPDRG